MKNNSFKTTRNILRICCLLILVFLFLIPFPKNKLRSPSEPYNSIEEEYIASIDTFIKTGKIIVPEGAIFTYDGTTIKIRDIDTNATEICKFTLENTTPIYEWNYTASSNAYYVSFTIRLIIPLLIYFILANFLEAFYNKHSEKKNRKSLQDIKNSSLNDNSSRNSFNCITCDKFSKCKCLSCMYLGKCTYCSSIDCEIAFEDENLGKPDFNKLPASIDIFGKCDTFKTNETCKCIDFNSQNIENTPPQVLASRDAMGICVEENESTIE